MNFPVSHLLVPLLLFIFCGLRPTECGRDRDTLNIGLEVPTWVRAGGTVTLGCNFDVGEEPVYQVKWYKGNKEFYRYTPRESPSVKIFPFPGLQVDLVKSNATQLTLTNLDLSMKGSYSCEVSTDAPDFLTAMKTAQLDVVIFPEFPPVISGLNSSYSVGDDVLLNCTSFRSKPVANLTWTINSQKVQSSYLVSFRSRGNLTETSQLTLNFQLHPSHFHRGKLTLECTSRIYSHHTSSQVTILQQDNPKLSSVVESGSSIVNDITATSSGTTLIGDESSHFVEIPIFILIRNLFR